MQVFCQVRNSGNFTVGQGLATTNASTAEYLITFQNAEIGTQTLTCTPQTNALQVRLQGFVAKMPAYVRCACQLGVRQGSGSEAEPMALRTQFLMAQHVDSQDFHCDVASGGLPHHHASH